MEELALNGSSVKHRWLTATLVLFLTSGLAITYTDKTRAAGMPQEKLDLYQQKDLEGQCKDSRSARILVERQLLDLKIKIRKSESRIREFKDKNYVTDLKTEIALSAESRNNLKQEINNASTQLAAQKPRLAKIQTSLGNKLVKKSWSDLKRAGVQESMIADYINVDSQTVALEQKIKALVYISKAYDDRAKNFSQLEKAQQELHREKEESLTAYKNLHIKLEELQIKELENQFKASPQSRKLLEKRLSDLEIQVNESASRIREFKEKHQVVDLALEASRSVEIINNLNREITITAAHLATEKSRITKMQSLFGFVLERAVQTVLISEAPGIQDAIIALEEALKQLALERARLVDQHPLVISLQQKVKILENNLRLLYEQASQSKPEIRGDIVKITNSGIQQSMVADYIKADIQRRALEQKITAFLYVYSAYRDRAKLLPQLEEIQLELYRQWEGASSTYKELRIKFAELQIEEQESQYKDPQQVRKFLEQKLSNSEIKIRESESRIREFREKNNITDLASEAEYSVKIINNLNQEISTTSAQLATAQYRTEKMQTFLGIKMPSIVQSKLPEITEAITALQQAQEKLALERTRFSDTNPSIIDLQQKIQALEAKLSQRYQQALTSKSPNIKSALQAEIIKEYATATIQKIALEKQINALLSVTRAYRDRTNRFPQLAQTQEELNRQLEISLISHKNLVVRLQNPRHPVKRVPDCNQNSYKFPIR
jgi:uncharacterized protein involved in exopolysaccharide biosynthesis